MVPHRRISIRICQDCGKAYVMSDNDLIYYVQKFGTIPLRCDECKERRRKMNEETTKSTTNVKE
jgi:hypothetical protein